MLHYKTIYFNLIFLVFLSMTHCTKEKKKSRGCKLPGLHTYQYNQWCVRGHINRPDYNNRKI